MKQSAVFVLFLESGSVDIVIIYGEVTNVFVLFPVVQKLFLTEKLLARNIVQRFYMGL